MKMNSNNNDDLLLLSELQSKLRSKDYKQALTSFRCIELQIEEINVPFPVAKYFYTSFLLCLLIECDFLAAKYLWKRISPSLKSDKSGSKLNAVWDVARYQISGNITSALSLLRSSWPKDMVKLIKSWHDSMVYNYLYRIAAAYSSIAVVKLSEALLLSVEDTLECTTRLSWKMDPRSNSEQGMYLIPSLQCMKDKTIQGHSIPSLPENESTRLLERTTAFAAHFNKGVLKVDLSSSSTSSAPYA